MSFISKRAKVVSDKPQYTEKIKTDNGYVWRYGPKHLERRNKEKKEKLTNLKRNIGKVKTQVDKDLNAEDLRTQAIAAVVSIILDTGMRVGNEDSAKAGTFGASTLKIKHVKFSPGKAKFEFEGKCKVHQVQETKDAKTIKVLKALVKGRKPNDFIFETDGHKIWDRAINRYLSDFGVSAKDLRGYYANQLMKDVLKDKDWEDALEETADIVGHESATLKNEYLDPDFVEKHEKKASLSKRASEDYEWAREQAFSAGMSHDGTPQDAKLFADRVMREHFDEWVEKGSDRQLWIDHLNALQSMVNDWRLTRPIPSPLNGLMVRKPYWWARGDDEEGLWREKTAGVLEDIYETGKGGLEWIKKRLYPGTKPAPKIRPLRNVKPTAKLNPDIQNAWLTLQPFLPPSAQLTSGERSHEDQLRIIRNEWQNSRAYLDYPEITDPTEQARILTKEYDFVVAGPGRSPHEKGKSFDVSGANLDEIADAVKFVSSKPQLGVNLKPLIERGNNAVHVTIYSAQYKPTEIARLIGSQNQSMADDQLNLGIRSTAKTTPNILNAWNTLRPFLPPGAELTSGLRTITNQKRLINYMWRQYKEDPNITDPAKQAEILRNKHNFMVNAPGTSSHEKGNSFDVSGANLDKIIAAAQFVSSHPQLGVRLRTYKEPGKDQQVVHMDVLGTAQYRPDEIAKLVGQPKADIEMAADDEVGEVLSAFIESNPPEDIKNEILEAFNKSAGILTEFPKICPCCGKVYETEDDFLHQPLRGEIRETLELDDPGWSCYKKLGYDLLYRDCDCGSTLVLKYSCHHKAEEDLADDEAGKYERESKDPKWQEVLIDKDNVKLTRKQMRDHYVKNAEKILKWIRGKPVMLYIATDKNKNILKRKHNDKPIVINSKENLIWWSDRRMSSIHLVMGPKTKFGWVDLDLHQNFPSSRAKEYAHKVVAALKKELGVSADIWESGGTGLHIQFELKTEQDIDKLREQLKGMLDELNKDYDDITTGIVKGKGMRSDISTLHDKGNLRAPYALGETWGREKKPLSEKKASLSKRAATSGWWLSPKGKLYPVPSDQTHPEFVARHNELFGLIDHDAYNTAFRKDWIRIAKFDNLAFEVPTDFSDSHLYRIQEALKHLPRSKMVDIAIWHGDYLEVPYSVLIGALGVRDLRRHRARVATIETKTQPIQTQERAYEEQQEQLEQEQHKKELELWETPEYDTSKATPEEALAKATENPADFLGRLEWRNRFPQFIDFAVGELAKREPSAYFISNYYKDPEYHKYNKIAILRLITSYPWLYFNKGLYLEPEFEVYKKPAAHATAEQHPKFFLNTVLNVMPEFEEFRSLAEESLKRRKLSSRQLIPGGLGAKLDPSDVDPKQLEMGIKIELEHSGNKELAQEIALDHLAEDPKYYTKLEKMERKAETHYYGWWLSPHGELHKVGKEGHISYLREHPELFGLKDLTQPEPILNDAAMNAGWIRIRWAGYLQFLVPFLSNAAYRNIQQVLHQLPDTEQPFVELVDAARGNVIRLLRKTINVAPTLDRARQHQIERYGSVGLKLELDEQERKIFKLLKDTAEFYHLPVELRVAGGWVRDAVLKQMRETK